LQDLEGLVFDSRQFGYCKVIDHLNRQVQVRFCGTGRDTWYTLDTLLRGKDFKWEPLPIGLHCRVEGRGECLIVRSPFGPSEGSTGVHEYTVEFKSQGRETATLTERELWPIPGSLAETPSTRMTGLQVDPWSQFRARDALLSGLTQLDRETAGIRALAASRIELLTHQAFVVGTVIDDARWRYILADEVGLGKTIEAGAIAHQLLSERPGARVLVLTPGSLSRQWLCEMHLSFGGRDFKLADLHDARLCDWPRWSRVICSLRLATQVHGVSLLTQPWDLVIVDEAHHLLWNRAQYDFVKALSVQAGGMLLLSAVPARERAQELLRLLQLIDPKGYAEGTVMATRFADLYREQPLIGRRLRILNSRLENPAGAVQDVQQAVRRLIDTQILSDDAALGGMLQNILAAQERDDVVRLSASLRDDVASRYRISRRILKNRRSQLLDQALLTSVERRLQTRWYEPTRLEEGAHEALLLILNRLLAAQAPPDALHILFRKAAPSLCDPVALMEVAKALRAYAGQNSLQTEDLDPSAALDYEGHELLLEQACATLAVHIDVDLADRLHTFAAAWLETESVPQRVTLLIETLDELQATGCQKILVFAGTLGAAELVVEQLQQRYGKASIAEFKHDLDDDEKEAEVTRFRRDGACRILVSDESGGEGRNFQFASAVVHFDLPWSVAAVEQRIGRLDRIGRKDPVPSVVIAAHGSIEGAWVRCLNEGFEVFTRSISGLEFMLREMEHRLIEHVLRDGPEGIGAMIEEVQVTSQKERASDDADALTDMSSFDRGRRYSHNPLHSADAHLEDAFPRYLRTIGVGEVAKRVTDQRDLNLKIWRLKPEDVTQVQLPGIHRDPNGQLHDHYGTFLRSVARDRPDLEFFSTGHALFEAVCSVARTNVRGRTFAVQVRVPASPAGVYLLTTWKVGPGPAGQQDVSLGRAERHLYGRQVRVMVDIPTEKVVDRTLAKRLEGALFAENAPITDLRPTLVAMMERSLQAWPAQVATLTELACRQAARENRELFAGDDQQFGESASNEVARLQRLGREDGLYLIEALKACQLAVQNPQIELDSLGIVEVLDSSDETPADS
jgi:ATP-dependent helicase HepA